MIKKKNGDGRHTATVEHEGFMIDLLDLIKGRLGFNYTVYEVADKAFGRERENGQWDGMVGELMKRENEVRRLSVKLPFFIIFGGLLR